MRIDAGDNLSPCPKIRIKGGKWGTDKRAREISTKERFDTNSRRKGDKATKSNTEADLSPLDSRFVRCPVGEWERWGRREDTWRVLGQLNLGQTCYVHCSPFGQERRGGILCPEHQNVSKGHQCCVEEMLHQTLVFWERCMGLEIERYSFTCCFGQSSPSKLTDLHPQRQSCDPNKELLSTLKKQFPLLFRSPSRTPWWPARLSWPCPLQ